MYGSNVKECNFSGRLRPGSKSCMVFMYSFQKQWLKTSTRNVKKNLKNLKKEIKLFAHEIDHALHCSKIVTNDSHHFANE